MLRDGSVSIWMRELEEGNSQAAQQIWERYYARLVGLAKKKLGAAPRRAADEEDVVACAFESFYRGVQKQRFPELEDRDDLWQVLVMLTVRKAVNQLVHQRRQKRGGGNIRGDSVFANCSIEDVVGDEPTPAFAASLTEEYRRLLECLDDNTLRDVAVQKMEGYSNEEIAQHLDCSSRTIVRKLKLIRKVFLEQSEGTI